MASLTGGGRQTCAATFPPDRFYCLLDELPLHLLPGAARQTLQIMETRPSTLVLNPACELRASHDLPDEVRTRKDLVSGFALQGTIAWVRHSTGGMLLPFWLGAALEELLQGLVPGQPLPASIPNETRALLAAAEILVPQEPTNSQASHEEFFRNARAQFRGKGYAPISDLIHPFHVAALRRYYQYQIRTGAIKLGDGQSARRYAAYNEPVARFFHHQISSTLSEVAGESLKPSYVYLASYLGGAELKKHTDRMQCEFSLTFCLDYSPEPALATPWPIKLDTPGSTVTVYQALGDGLAYRGTRLPHFRDMLGEGQTSTSIFFHYVSEDFEGSLD